MIQLLNNIWIALSSENVELVNLLILPAGIIEHYLFMNLFLKIFNVESLNKQKIRYVISIFIISILTLNLIPSPYNVFVNYACMIFLIKSIFKLSLLKSFISLIFSSAIFGLLNTLLQNPYITILNINYNQFINTPLYRLTFVFIIYACVFIISILLGKFKNLRFTLDFLDSLDKKTLKILIINLLLGFITLCVQIITTAFYIDIVPIIISILNFILLLSFLVLSIYSFTRVIKLANTTRDLASAEEFNKSLQNLYDEVKGFKHDFNNIVSTIDGYIETNDITRLKKYFIGVKRDCKITNNLSLLNPSTINHPGIYSLLNNKYFKAYNLGISFDIDVFIDLNNLDVNMYTFSRILGILVDNAIEEAEKCENKVVKLSLRRDYRNNRALIIIENTYLNKDVDLDKIFEKGESGKENHSGIGLWEVKKYVSKSKNLDLFTSKTNEFFKQELSIYDIVKK